MQKGRRSGNHNFVCTVKRRPDSVKNRKTILLVNISNANCDLIIHPLNQSWLKLQIGKPFKRKPEGESERTKITLPQDGRQLLECIKRSSKIISPNVTTINYSSEQNFPIRDAELLDEA
jgi:virulence-associated protein VagC